MKIAPRTNVDPAIRSGRPVIKGTRVPVETVLARLAAGMSPEEIASEYEITVEDVRAAVGYAASIVAGEEIRVVA